MVISAMTFLLLRAPRDRIHAERQSQSWQGRREDMWAQEEAMLLRRLPAAAGAELAILAHEVLMGALRCMVEAYGTGAALPTLDDSSQRPWYAEGRFMHMDLAG
jgi:hypothetical protein